MTGINVTQKINITSMTKPDDQSWLNEVRTYEKCPYCKKGILNRIKRGFFVKHIFTWVGNKRYQCDSCGKTKYEK